MPDTPRNDRQTFEPSFATSTFESTSANEGLNVCRTVALGAPFQPSNPLTGLENRLSEMGLSPSLAAVAWDWPDFAGDRALEEFAIEAIEAGTLRRQATESVLNDPTPFTSSAWLISAMCSDREIESAAAAATIRTAIGARQILPDDQFAGLWRDGRFVRSFDYLTTYINQEFGITSLGSPWMWVGVDDLDTDLDSEWPGERWSRIARDSIAQPVDEFGRLSGRLLLLAQIRLRLASSSANPIVRQFAAASSGAAGSPSAGSGRTTIPGPPRPHNSADVSALIHGTWAWAGDWWRPRAEFHDYVLQNVRRNVYAGGAPFSWSGALRERHREIAADDFTLWAGEQQPKNIDALFGHSYGGEVAARVWNNGTSVSKLVLLSTPVTPHVLSAAKRGAVIVDIRLPFDPVLVLARQPQAFPRTLGNVHPVTLNWQLDHAATHDPKVWQAEDIKRQAGL